MFHKVRVTRPGISPGTMQGRCCGRVLRKPIPWSHSGGRALWDTSHRPRYLEADGDQAIRSQGDDEQVDQELKQREVFVVGLCTVGHRGTVRPRLVLVKTYL